MWRQQIYSSLPYQQNANASMREKDDKLLSYVDEMVSRLAGHEGKVGVGIRMCEVIRHTYMTHTASDNIDGILNKLSFLCPYKSPMPRRTYFRLLGQAKAIMRDMANQANEVNVTAEKYLHSYRIALWKKSIYTSLPHTGTRETEAIRECERKIAEYESFMKSLSSTMCELTMETIKQTYMSLHHATQDEILTKFAPINDCKPLSKGHYFRLKKKAIQIVSKHHRGEHALAHTKGA